MMMKNKQIVCECLGLPNSETNPTDLETSATWANMINMHSSGDLLRRRKPHNLGNIWKNNEKHSFNCLENQRVQMIKVLVLSFEPKNNEWWILSSIYLLTAFLAPSKKLYCRSRIICTFPQPYISHLFNKYAWNVTHIMIAWLKNGYLMKSSPGIPW